MQKLLLHTMNKYLNIRSNNGNYYAMRSSLFLKYYLETINGCYLIIEDLIKNMLSK